MTSLDSLRQLIAFLDGSGEIDDTAFGEPHPTERGRYWWRKRLPAIAELIERCERAEAEVEGLRSDVIAAKDAEHAEHARAERAEAERDALREALTALVDDLTRKAAILRMEPGALVLAGRAALTPKESQP